MYDKQQSTNQITAKQVEKQTVCKTDCKFKNTDKAAVKKSEMGKTKKIAGTAVFSALAFIISLLEFPIFPAAGFLKLDFSATFILLSGFIFGPISAVIASFVKELLRFLIGSGTGGVGEVANFIVTMSFVLLPVIVYTFKKGLKTVIATLVISCFLMAGAALLANKFIMFPLYAGEAAAQMFSALWKYVLFFNLIKAAVISLLTILLYKRVSGWIKKI